MYTDSKHSRAPGFDVRTRGRHSSIGLTTPSPMRALLIAALALSACTDRPEAVAAPMSEPAAAASEASSRTDGVAVVELFTSEGCSSCPPADRVLKDFADRADESGEAILPLSFHVDYWNRLGWADPYSSAAFTARQRAYAAAGAFDRGRVYTPATIVNGRNGFVGSRRATAERAVARALEAAPATTLDLEVAVSGRDVTVRYDAAAPDGAVVHLALVEDDTSQDVTRGENRGRRLVHARVVRAFETVEAGAGTATLRLPSDLEAEGARIVGYVQDGPVGRILGGTQARLG